MRPPTPTVARVSVLARRGTRAALLVLLAACATQSAPPEERERRGDVAAGAPLEEARRFMESYARDLAAGDRAALVARYDPRGAYVLGNGRKQLMTAEQIRAIYGGAEWSPPAAFEWRDLSFEPAGPDAVVVAGLFAWTGCAGQAPAVFSYSSLLVRGDGGLRIRMEDESSTPGAPPPAPCPSGS
jgi:hypothetical protein